MDPESGLFSKNMKGLNILLKSLA